MNLKSQYSTPLFQAGLVLTYFPIYYFCTVWAALFYAAIFVFGDMWAWKTAVRKELKDEFILPLVTTVVSSYIAVIFFFANLYEAFGTIESSGGAISGLWLHVYYSVVTFTTLGYGDFLPHGVAKIIAAFQASLGFLYFAVIVGVASSIFYQKVQKT